MDFVTRIENLPFIVNFKRKLRKKDYVNSTYIAKDTAELFREVIKNSIADKSIETLAELILLVTYLGKMFTAIDPVQFCTGNTIKRILHIIREEVKESMTEDKIDYDKKQDFITEKIKDIQKNFASLFRSEPSRLCFVSV